MLHVCEAHDARGARRREAGDRPERVADRAHDERVLGAVLGALEEALRGLSAAGFENVEIGAVKGFLEHLDPDDLTPRTIDATRRIPSRLSSTMSWVSDSNASTP